MTPVFVIYIPYSNPILTSSPTPTDQPLSAALLLSPRLVPKAAASSSSTASLARRPDFLEDSPVARLRSFGVPAVVDLMLPKRADFEDVLITEAVSSSS